MLAVSLSFSEGQVSGQSSDVTAIKDCVVEYFRFARDKDKTGVASVLSRTPNEYWVRGEKKVHAESDTIEPATSHSYAPLDDLSFQALTGLIFLVAGKAKLNRNQIRPVVINGKLAKASFYWSLETRNERRFLAAETAREVDDL